MADIELALAVLRLYYLFSFDNGPWNVLAKFRARVGVKYTDEGKALPTNQLAYLILCAFCSTLYFSLFLVVGLYLYNAYFLLVIKVLAISMAAVFLQDIYKWLVHQHQRS